MESKTYTITVFVAMMLAAVGIFGGYGVLSAIQADRLFYIAYLSIFTIAGSWAAITTEWFTIKDDAKSTYSVKDGATDTIHILIVPAIAIGIFTLVIFTQFGKTEKPIEQLNGFSLGQTYTLEMAKQTYPDAYTLDNHDAGFVVSDKQRPQMLTYVYTDDDNNVFKVMSVYGPIEHTSASALKDELRDIALEEYGGQPSWRKADFFDGKNTLTVDAYMDSVVVSIEALADESTLVSPSGLAEQERESVKARARASFFHNE